MGLSLFSTLSSTRRAKTLISSRGSRRRLATLRSPRAGGGIGRRARLRALWPVGAVEVQVLSSASCSSLAGGAVRRSPTDGRLTPLDGTPLSGAFEIAPPPAAHRQRRPRNEQAVCSSLFGVGLQR